MTWLVEVLNGGRVNLYVLMGKGPQNGRGGSKCDFLRSLLDKFSGWSHSWHNQVTIVLVSFDVWHTARPNRHLVLLSAC